MMTGKQLFDKTTTIDTLLTRCPQLAEVFNQHGMACVGCVFDRFHSLADAAAIYQIDLGPLIDQLTFKCFAELQYDDSDY